MKATTKTFLDVVVSLAWLIAYVGSGAFLLAREAAANLNYVSAFIPIVVFLWVGGYFVGHAIIGKLFLFIVRSKPLASGNQLQDLNIDNLPIVSRITPKRHSEGYSYRTTKQNNNDKKDTAKIARFSKSRPSNYKVPQYC